jgi:hypothetical protein
MGVKRCRRKAENISAGAVIMKETLVKLEGRMQMKKNVK